MLALLLSFASITVLPLLIVVSGLLIILRVVRPGTALGFIGLFVLSLVAEPFIEELFDQLPLWVMLLIGIVIGFWCVRTVLEFVLGPHAAGHVIGAAVVGLVRILFAILFLPLHMLAWALRARRRPAARQVSSTQDPQCHRDA